jgi:hypothetical protein
VQSACFTSAHLIGLLSCQTPMLFMSLNLYQLHSQLLLTRGLDCFILAHLFCMCSCQTPQLFTSSSLSQSVQPTTLINLDCFVLFNWSALVKVGTKFLQRHQRSCQVLRVLLNVAFLSIALSHSLAIQCCILALPPAI